MLTDSQQQFSIILTKVAELLDITDTKYKEAVSRYEAVGKWLDADDSQLHIHKPTLYTQGSFRIGTMIKPITDRDEYDIDLVCHLEIDKKNITQEKLKNMIGDRLKSNEIYRKILKDEGRRCWTLDYANEFHMDILPAIPDYDRQNDAILITDKKLRTWQNSNPKGYARWFTDRMKVIFHERKIAIAESMKVNIEDVPEYKVRTPLQKSVQILKRHRDIYFKDKDYKPISIIITTLAAQNYQNEANLFEAITNIINGMSNINSVKNNEGKYCIPNPTNIKENFADKWNENTALAVSFFKWLVQLKDDFDTASCQREMSKIQKTLSPAFGGAIVENALEKYGNYNRAKDKVYPEVKFSTKPNNPWMA